MENKAPAILTKEQILDILNVMNTSVNNIKEKLPEDVKVQYNVYNTGDLYRSLLVLLGETTLNESIKNG